jgi:phosphopantetheinyl transferase (holo-ACP synthase)
MILAIEEMAPPPQLTYRMIPKGHEPALHVSLSDDPPMALAFVILEAKLKA